MDVDHSLVSQTLQESAENGVHLGSSGLSKMSNFLSAQRGFNMACLNINDDLKLRIKDYRPPWFEILGGPLQEVRLHFKSMV